MTEFEGLYTAVVKSGPKEIERNLATIPGIHQQEALDNALEKAITLTPSPKIGNVKFLLQLGADPNGPGDEQGIILSYAYASGLLEIIELLLQAGADVNADNSDVLEQAVRTGDTKYVVRFVEAGGDVNTTQLIATDNLLQAAKGHPDIQKFLINKGIDGEHRALEKRLKNIETPTIHDYTFPNPDYNPNVRKKLPKYRGSKNKHDTPNTPPESIDPFLTEHEELPSHSVGPKEQLFTQDHSARFFVVRGNTKEHQNMLVKHGGRFIRGKGWLLPVKYRKAIEVEIAKIIEMPAPLTPEPFKGAAITPVPSPEPDDTPNSPTPVYSSTPVDTTSPDEIEEMMTNAMENSILTRPQMNLPENIELYTPHGHHGVLTTSYQHPQLFKLDSQSWDSVERYLMYKMYEGSYKAKAIREADTLEEARHKFNVTKVPAAKTPKQLVLNQKLLPLSRSELNSKYPQHRDQLFQRATKAKFEQNRLLKDALLNTKTRQLVNRNPQDEFGYEGNLLGNTLMKIRADLTNTEFNKRDTPKTNSMTIQKYSANKNFCVIRGDPSPELATEIRNLGTYHTKAGKLIRGKLNLNLQGGAGWLVPLSRKAEAKKLVFDTYPNDKKLQVSGKAWVKKRVKKFLEVAILFSKFRNRPEVGSDDLMFSIKDIFGAEDFLGQDYGQPSEKFMQMVWKYMDKQDAVISDAALKLLWDVMSKMIEECTNGIEQYSQMKEIMNKIEAAVLDTPINTIEGLTERESIVVGAFVRIYKLLRKINEKDAKVCVMTIHIMLGKHHYEEIREIYSKKAKLQGENDYPDEETQFKHRFHIHNTHIQAVLDQLPKDLSKKCQLLVLTTLDYIMNLEGEGAITISKRLIILSQKGKQPTPTPKIKTPTPKLKTPTPQSDIPKLPSTSAVEESTPEVKTPENPETPNFDEEE